MWVITNDEIVIERDYLLGKIYSKFYDNGTMFTPDIVKGYLNQFPNYFKCMDYANFSWTRNIDFFYPFTK